MIRESLYLCFFFQNLAIPVTSQLGGCDFDDNILVKDKANTINRSAVKKAFLFYWEDHKVPYFFNGSIEQKDIEQIKKAMATIQQNTCLLFEEVQDSTAYEHSLEIFVTYRHHSTVGMVTSFSTSPPVPPILNKVIMSFYKRDGDQIGKMLVLHELGHVLGLSHTQRRPDRDEFVSIIEGCVMDGHMHNFDILEEGEVDTYGVPYKCNSMMHYLNNTFSIAADYSCLTIKPIPGKCDNNLVGPGAEPVEEDWDLINRAHCAVAF